MLDITLSEDRLTFNTKSPRSPQFMGVGTAEDMILVDVEDVELRKVTELGPLTIEMKVDIDAIVDNELDWDVEVALDTGVKIELEVDFDKEEV